MTARVHVRVRYCSFGCSDSAFLARYGRRNASGWLTLAGRSGGAETVKSWRCPRNFGEPTILCTSLRIHTKSRKMSNQFGENKDFTPLDPVDLPGPRRKKTKKDKETVKQERKSLKHRLAVDDSTSTAPNERRSKRAKTLDSDEIPTEKVFYEQDQVPVKKAQLFDNSDEGSDADDGTVSLKVNDEYARRFEHNKKRAEKQRCMQHSMWSLYYSSN
jgi:hypothetical protein